jgi:hypothetical protein
MHSCFVDRVNLQLQGTGVKLFHLLNKYLYLFLELNLSKQLDGNKLVVFDHMMSRPAINFCLSFPSEVTSASVFLVANEIFRNFA